MLNCCSKNTSGTSLVYRPLMNTSLDFHAQNNGKLEANPRKCQVVAEWLKSLMPELDFPQNCTEELLRTYLFDGTVLCRTLNRLRPNTISEIKTADSENVKKFLAVVKDMGLPDFKESDLEKGSMKPVLDCLLSVRAQFIPIVGNENFPITDPVSNCGNKINKSVVDDKQNYLSELNIQRPLRSPNPVLSDPSAASLHQVGTKFHEVFQMKQGRYADLPAAKITEMVKSNGLDNAPTQSLLSVVNGILEEGVERNNGEIPQRVALLLKKVVQEIERRISTQAEHLRTQNNLFKAREEKYQSRIKVLEALAAGISQETQIVTNQVQQIKTERSRLDDKKIREEQDAEKIMKEREQYNLEISKLKQELELAKEREQMYMQMERDKNKNVEKNIREEQVTEQIMKEREQNNLEISKLKQELEVARKELEQKCMQMEREKTKTKEKNPIEEQVTEKIMKEREQNNQEVSKLKQELEIARKELEQKCIQMETERTKIEEKSIREEQVTEQIMKEREKNNLEVSKLKQELETTRKSHEQKCKQMEAEAKKPVEELEQKLKDLEGLLVESRNKAKELEMTSQKTHQTWNKKEDKFRKAASFQINVLRELKLAHESIKKEILTTQNDSTREFKRVGGKLIVLKEAAENYHAVLTENRKLYNEVQDLKGNIRVFCRIRPLFAGQSENQSTIDQIGDNGELVLANPSKPGRDGLREFRFNKVYGPSASQADVFLDTQPLIRSVLDGYNVCIFAYGQTGSGKTYTMIGPNGATEEEWGVNFRALNDLFQISQARKSLFKYEIGVQMVEIYNEQIRDLLSSDTSQKRLGVLTTSQPNGLAVPDASMLPVTSTNDVINLMDVGLTNRAMGATAMNARSSRSHSVLTIHVRGADLKSGATLKGSLHLVDLAGSERLDRSEATGDRLKEAQHINKSLSALGDVIFALAQKNPHVPYRNSKLTQVLQSSLGGQAKTLMFVQLNPDVNSYSETISTLKFAERVSGVELGAAKSSKEGKDVRDLMEQVASLRDRITKKDEEIERLQLLKDLKNVYPNGNNEKKLVSSTSFKNPNGESPKSKTRLGRDAEMLSPRGEDTEEVSERSERSRSSSALSRLSLKDTSKTSSGLKKSGSASSLKPSSPASKKPSSPASIKPSSPAKRFT